VAYLDRGVKSEVSDLVGLLAEELGYLEKELSDRIERGLFD